MITPRAELSVSRQCTLLGVARSSFYYRPQSASPEELDLLARLERIFTIRSMVADGCKSRSGARAFSWGADASGG